MRPVKKYVTCIMAFFTSFNFVTLSEFYSTMFPVLFTKPIQKLQKESSYMAASACHVISKEVENDIFKHNLIFRHICMYKQHHWQSSGIIIFWCKYYIVTSDALVGSFLDVLFLLLVVILLELQEKPRRKD